MALNTSDTHKTIYLRFDRQNWESNWQRDIDGARVEMSAIINRLSMSTVKCHSEMSGRRDRTSSPGVIIILVDVVAKFIVSVILGLDLF